MNPVEKIQGRRRIEVADVRAEEQHQDGIVGRPRRGRAAQTLLVGRLMADHRDMFETREPLLGLLECLRRDVDQVHARRTAARLQCFGEHHDLLAAAAPELDDRAAAELVHDLGRMTAEQARSRRA